MASLLLGIAAAVAASAMFKLAVVVQASEARSVPRRLALRLAPLTVVQPADAAGLVLLLVFGSRILGDPIGFREKFAVGGIVVGVTGLAFVAPERSTHHVSGVWIPLVALAIVAVAPVV